MCDVLLSYEEAAATVARHANDLPKPGVESLPLAAAAARILAEPIYADTDCPAFPRSTRDGYACRATEANARRTLRVAGTTYAGDPPPAPLDADTCQQVMTGAAVPDGADAVAMIEHVEGAAGTIRLTPPRTLSAGENVVARGAQGRAGDVLLAAGARMGSAQLALAASCGYASLAVYRRPRVAILTTGDELVPVEATPRPGQIRNSNAPMLAALVAESGGDAMVLPAAADTDAALEAALDAAESADLLLISGGVSVGSHDLVEASLARRNAEFYFTGVRMQPGKPLVFGRLSPGRESASAAGKLFFGLPGNPISSAATFRLFAEPVVEALAGRADRGPRFVSARLGAAVRHKRGLTRFLPARCDFSASGGALPAVTATPWHGSGDLTAFAGSNCFLVVPEETDSLATDASVRILIF